MFDRSARLYDVIYSFKDYEAEARYVHELIQRHRPGAGTLLDVACGTGLHLEHLKRHYAAEGLDISEDLLDMASRRNPDVSLHRGDMIDFDLGRRFDAVTCLFSSIGYAREIDTMRQAVATMARHLSPGGVLIVEQWVTPEDWEGGQIHALFVDEPDLKIARINTSSSEGRLSILDLHYLVGTPEGIEYFTEHHEIGLFTHEEYDDAFERAGLDVVERDHEALMGRGVVTGRALGGQAGAET